MLPGRAHDHCNRRCVDGLDRRAASHTSKRITVGIVGIFHRLPNPQHRGVGHLSTLYKPMLLGINRRKIASTLIFHIIRYPAELQVKGTQLRRALGGHPARQLLTCLAPYGPHVSNLTLALRHVVLEEAPQAIESISKGYALAIGYSFTGKPLKDGFCHIVTYNTHVNLGFNRGALLPDPVGILVGKGKSIRHITIRNENELERPFIRRYLQAAIDQIGGPPTLAERPSPASKQRNLQR